jgi:hypothetical protein
MDEAMTSDNELNGCFGYRFKSRGHIGYSPSHCSDDGRVMPPSWCWSMIHEETFPKLKFKGSRTANKNFNLYLNQTLMMSANRAPSGGVPGANG